MSAYSSSPDLQKDEPFGALCEHGAAIGNRAASGWSAVAAEIVELVLAARRRHQRWRPRQLLVVATSPSEFQPAYTAAMPSSKVTRTRVYFGLMLLLAVVNAVRVLRDPQALRFFGVAIVVVAAVGAVGSLSALILVAVRRLAAR